MDTKRLLTQKYRGLYEAAEQIKSSYQCWTKITRKIQENFDQSLYEREKLREDKEKIDDRYVKSIINNHLEELELLMGDLDHEIKESEKAGLRHKQDYENKIEKMDRVSY